MLGGDAATRRARSGADVSDLLLRDGEWDVVDPGSAGWRYLSFRVERLRDGESVARKTGGEEIALVPLGGRCAVEAGGERFELGGRASVFDGMPWALYLPRDTRVHGDGVGDVEVAVCGRARRRTSRASARHARGRRDRGARLRQRNASDQPHPQARVSRRSGCSSSRCSRPQATGRATRRTSTT